VTITALYKVVILLPLFNLMPKAGELLLHVVFGLLHYGLEEQKSLDSETNDA
jgi:hypothetical protein